MLLKHNRYFCVQTFLCFMFVIMLTAGVVLGVMGCKFETVQYVAVGDSFKTQYVQDNVIKFMGICVGTILSIIGFFGVIITICYCCVHNEIEYSEILSEENKKVAPHYYSTPNYQ
ncbi:Hypothetical_protein [Hexamita inflata]|uniref:Hypothetical_protein n=1 Tax=Hexamita inflata TaxID=28002 RepID=A0AA86QQF3_9EUKA|nr:Hypothetical protein HINF_LOCUS46192 [Hexamita inflata]